MLIFLAAMANTSSSEAAGTTSPSSGEGEAARNRQVQVTDTTQAVIVELEDQATDQGMNHGTDSEVVAATKKRKLKSAVWNEYKRLQVNGKWKAECVWCRTRLGGETKNGTTHLHDHLKSCQARQVRKGLKQSTLKMGTDADGKVCVEKYIFDQDVSRKALSLMICVHEYPLSMVDHVGFRKFCATLQPMFTVGTRNTIRQDILDMYGVQKNCMVKYFQQFESRVAITTDMWTASHQNKGYMAVTAHFIDEKWTMKSFLLR
jgi:hypothetical protein